MKMNLVSPWVMPSFRSSLRWDLKVPGPADGIGAASRCVRDSPERGSAGVSGRPEQLTGVAASRPVALVGAEHPDQLAEDTVALQRRDRRAGRDPVAAGLLDDREVTRGQRRHLWQVGDAQHLPPGRERTQMLAHRPRRAPAHAGVDLVEDEQGDGFAVP
jgi:hypothetical protein